MGPAAALGPVFVALALWLLSYLTFLPYLLVRVRATVLVAYYDSVGGDYEQLKSISFEWKRLRTLFDQKTL